MLVSDEEKRWIVVGIAMFQVTAPVLRDFVKQRMDTHYANLDAYWSGLATPCTLNTLTYHHVNPDPNLQRLKFQNINNNSQMHGTYKRHYNYNICSSLDLAKLYLPDYLAKFSAFDESLDMTAILRLLGFANYWPARIFSPLIKMSADDVRDDVRNNWGHFDMTKWTEAFFNDCFAKLEALVKSLGLASGIEMTTLTQLKDWQTKGCQLCMGHAVDQHLLSLVQHDVKELISKYVEMKANISDLKDQQISTRDQLEKHDKQFEELLKENEEILKRLVRVEKAWSEELQILRSRVEEVESKLSETDVTVEQLGRKSENHEEKLEHLEENSKQQAKKIGQLEQEVRSQWNSDIKRDVTVKQLGRKSEQHEEKLEHLEQEVRSRWNSGIKRIKREHSPMQPFDVESCRRKLAEHYKRSAKVSTSVWSPLCQVELDQIYTRLSWVEKEHTPTGPRELELRHYTDLFTPGKNGLVPKRMLVEGETGIGKSTFVQRLTVDWAELDDAKMTEAQKDVLRKFHLVVSVNLKVVSKCQSFEEVLRCSRLFPLDPVVSTDDLSTYICNNQEKVLLVFDGYDEYRSTSEAEAQFGDRSDSPIFDIFQRNYLRDCAVMVTTRFSRGDELRRCADKQAKITGFDETDQRDFMEKMLGSQKEIRDLMRFLDERNMSDLAKVPLLNLFFCLMWKQAKQQLTKLVQTETILYQTMIRHILQYSHKRLSPTQVCKVKEEDYEEILAEIGKVALEALLKGSQLFEYGQLSEKVRGEKSIIVGLCQLSECDTSLEPMEMVSFIHKSIQEYLAAWYISNKCVPEGNLGGIEEHTRTFDDCKALENVFKFVCGTTVDGAAKVFKHLGTIRASDPSLDLSKYIPDEENEAFLPLDFLTRNELSFNALIVRLFKEGSSLGSEAEVARNLLDCCGGVVYVDWRMEILPIAKALSQVARSWSLLVESGFPVSKLYDSLKLVDLLNIPVNITEKSKTFKLGDFLTKYQNLNCNQCRFSSVICYRGDRARFYITHLELCGFDVHVRVFAEVAATIPPEHLSTKLYENQSCMKFLTECFVVDGGFNTESLEDLGTMMRSWKHLKRISIFGCDDSGCDVLKMVPNPELRALSIESKCGVACTFTSAGAVKLAGLLPRFNSLTFLELDLTDCSAEALASLAPSITHKTLKRLLLEKITLTPEAAAALGQALGEMTSLEILFLEGEGNCLNAEEMTALFGGFKRTIPLTELSFLRFSARGILGPLINSLRFFPDLDDLCLAELDIDEHDLRGLLESCRFIPKLRLLALHGNPLGHAVTSFVLHISNLPNVFYLNLTGAHCSEEDKNDLREAFGRLPHFDIVDF